MALVTLPLYATPADVYDYLSAERAQLSLDDQNQATGYTIQVTADAVAAATSLSVMPLVAPLLKGTVLVFQGGGMEEAVQVTLTATAALAATSLSVSALGNPVTAQARAMDNGANVALAQRLLKGCRYGTAEVKRYCGGRYEDSDLQTCWSVNQWATICAAKWVATRVCRSLPASVKMDYDNAREEMREVMVGSMSLEDIPTRTAGWPFISNVTIDIGYTYKKVRTEPSISEATPTQYPAAVDWNSALSFEW